MTARTGNDLAASIHRELHPDVLEFDPMLILAIIQILIQLAKCWLDRKRNNVANLAAAAKRGGAWAIGFQRWLARAVRRAAGGPVRYEQLGGDKLTAEIWRLLAESPTGDIHDTITHLAQRQ